MCRREGGPRRSRASCLQRISSNQAALDHSVAAEQSQLSGREIGRSIDGRFSAGDLHTPSMALEHFPKLVHCHRNRVTVIRNLDCSVKS